MRTSILLAVLLLVIACAGTQLPAPKPVPPPLEFLSAWGIPGDDPGQLEAPVSIAVDAVGNIFIADIRKGATLVHKYDFAGHPLLAFFVQGCQRPSSIAVDWGGALYLVDQRLGAIYIFKPDGELFKTIRRAAGRSLQDIEGFAVDVGGNLYVVETKANRILKLTWQGRFLKSWGTKGGGPGQFNSPTKVTVANNGSVFVADTGNHRIQEFSAEGEFIRAWDFPFSYPPAGAEGNEGYGLAASDKFVVASDRGKGIVEFWTLDGQPKMSVDNLARTAFPQPPVPAAVSLTSKGELLVLDATAPRVLRFRINF